MGNARKLFKRIQAAFPGLEMKVGHDLQTGGVSMDIPIQTGLTLPVYMCLENNGLRLKVGHYQLEWFPCSDRTKQEKFFNAVCGLLSGRLRLTTRNAKKNS